jgi:hypothetical protein
LIPNILGTLNPKYETDTALQERWNYDILEEEGEQTFRAIVEERKQVCNTLWAKVTTMSCLSFCSNYFLLETSAPRLDIDMNELEAHSPSWTTVVALPVGRDNLREIAV